MHSRLFLILFSQALQKQQIGDRDVAVSYYEQLLKVDPDNAVGLVRYGMMLMDEQVKFTAC